MDRGNDQRQHTATTLALPLLAIGTAIAAAALAADAVAYGAWRVVAFAVVLAVLLPLVRRVPAPGPRPAVSRPAGRLLPCRAAIPPGLRTSNELVLVLLPGFAPFLAFGMSEGCGGCPEAIWARNVIIGGSLLAGVVYVAAQTRWSTPERAHRVADAVVPVVGLLAFACIAWVSRTS